MQNFAALVLDILTTDFGDTPGNKTALTKSMEEKLIAGGKPSTMVSAGKTRKAFSCKLIE